MSRIQIIADLVK